MSWLTPIGLLGLLGLVALIIIYIIKPNYQNKVISSTYIWKLSLKLRKKQIPISKLRSILLFICQVLAISVFAFILAQPVIKAEEEPIVNEKIIIIDASASMLTETNDETRFERAVESVRLLADQTFLAEDSSGRLTLIVAGEKPTILASGVDAERKDMIYDALDNLIDPANESPITYGRGDLAAAIKLAEETTAVNPESEVLLYTDTAYIDPGKIVIKDVKDPSEWNASILDARAIMDDNYYRFEIDVACYGGTDADIEVYLDIYGTNNDKVSIHLGATARCMNGNTTTVVFAKNPLNDKTPEENGISQTVDVFSYEYATIRIEENDSFKQDNSFELHGGAKPTLRIQYASSSPNNFFATALLVLRDTLSKRWEVEFVEVKPDEEAEDEGFDFYIYEHNAVPKKLPDDGVVILANPSTIPNIAGVRLGKLYTTNNQEVNLTTYDAEHPLMNGVEAENITVTKFTELLNPDGYSTLMTVKNGAQEVPVVMAKNDFDQKIAIISFSLNYSNFSMLLDFPLFMYNIFQYYSPSTITGHLYEVNEEISVNSRSEILSIKDQESNELFVIEEFPTTVSFKIPGVYTISQTPISGEEVTEKFFVKMPEAECNIAEVVDSLTNPFFAVREEQPDFDLLIYFAIALVTLLFAEWWLQSREQF